ncbi:P-loop containing nucleoside triphosphate hydrolase protein [Phellopilus nigrolimitatus]|nr:P-loop containing nucleoside triphosphate hydrolase protein [Phellopilus nigrolimitatus]
MSYASSPFGMDDLSFEEIARECGIEVDDFSYQNDSGLGFVSQDTNPGPHYGSNRDAQYYDGIDGYGGDLWLFKAVSQLNARGSNPRNVHSIRLRPISELPDIYRGIFKFGVFNAVQSKCYNTVRQILPPTGAGKTVLFELALIEMLMASGHHSSLKCVYVAPTKVCCEMTGDTVQMGRSAWNVARSAKVIEKWDSLTRSWHDHGDFLAEIKLFLVDEVHILNESRGSTLEVVISRMKARGLDIRLLLVSATVPNIRDIADWVGNPSIDSKASATVYEFGEEFRPCKITRHIYGYPRKNQNDFQFARTLDFKVYPILQQHSCGKPTLIFCNTRKGVLATGEQLLKEYEQTVSDRQSPPWTPPRQLEKLAKAGIGVHHAGLSLDDRRGMEELFLNGSLRVVAATSVCLLTTAHTVVIKGVKLYMNNAWQEYSDLDIIQMIGRAGRPQFDKEGVAIILCEQELEHKYKNLSQGKTVLESSLHQNLSEHINSEIGIGTISNIQTAKEWLRNTFLRQRIQRNPGHYHMGKSMEQSWEEKLDDMVLSSVKKLKTNELVAAEGEEEAAELSVTEYGDIMSKMGSIIKLPERPGIREIVYNKMRDHPDIRYKIKKVEKASDKALILIQAVLGGISLSSAEYKSFDSQPALDALSIFRHTARIARVVVEIAIVKKNGAQLKHGLELVRCLTAKAWEDRPVVLRQIESIGEKSYVLAEHGITCLQALRRQEPARIEILLNRRPPYGHEVLAFVQDMPQYELKITASKDAISSYAGRKPVSVELTVECRILDALIGKKAKSNKQRSRSLGMTSILTTTSDMDFIDFRRISTKALRETKSFTVTAELTKPSQSVCVLESFAGLTVTQTYKPSIPAKEYPTLDTHPKTSEEMLLDGLEDDPDFWSNMMDDEHDSKTDTPGKYKDVLPLTRFC